MSPDTPSHEAHRRQALADLGCIVITVSDSRDLDSDRSGSLIVSKLEEAGHRVIDRMILRDEAELIGEALSAAMSRKDCDAVLITGGTGLSPRDVTVPALEDFCDRLLPGFGEIFRMLSYEEIGAAAMLSRASAGIRGGRAFFSMPGSTGAVKLAMDRLVVPEIGHLIREARKSE